MYGFLLLQPTSLRSNMTVRMSMPSMIGKRRISRMMSLIFSPRFIPLSPHYLDIGLGNTWILLPNKVSSHPLFLLYSFSCSFIYLNPSLETCAKRFLAISQYSGETSIPTHLLLRRFAEMQVVPEPQKESNIISSSFVDLRINEEIKSIGFSAGCFLSSILTALYLSISESPEGTLGAEGISPKIINSY